MERGIHVDFIIMVDTLLPVVFVHVCVYAFVHVCVCVCMCLCVSMCACVYVCVLGRFMGFNCGTV